jgi:hypothetical protein
MELENLLDNQQPVLSGNAGCLESAAPTAETRLAAVGSLQGVQDERLFPEMRGGPREAMQQWIHRPPPWCSEGARPRRKRVLHDRLPTLVEGPPCSPLLRRQKAVASKRSRARKAGKDVPLRNPGPNRRNCLTRSCSCRDVNCAGNSVGNRSTARHQYTPAGGVTCSHDACERPSRAGPKASSPRRGIRQARAAARHACWVRDDARVSAVAVYSREGVLSVHQPMAHFPAHDLCRMSCGIHGPSSQSNQALTQPRVRQIFHK